MTEPGKTIVFLGCPLDSDERQESLDEKLAQAGAGAADPFQAVMELIRREVDPSLWREEGSLEVPAWLLPIPPAQELDKLVVDNMVGFIDGEGCRAAAAALGEMVAQRVLPDIPCLLGVDHSLSGGVLLELARRYGSQNISLVVLDSHLDAIPTPVMAGAIAYDMESNPQSRFDPADPFLRDRPDAYHASSFLHHLLAEGVVLAENLWVLGISDYPAKRAFRQADPRARRYTRVWSGLKSQGGRILTKKELTSSPGRLGALLGQIKTPYVYLSVDMDLGARNALEGVRFRDWQGLNEPQIYRLAQAIMKVLERGVRLIGLDLCEFNPRRAGGPGPERTYRIAANLIEMICFGRQPSA